MITAISIKNPSNQAGVLYYTFVLPKAIYRSPSHMIMVLQQMV
jgi:hypothetical protein